MDDVGRLALIVSRAKIDHGEIDKQIAEIESHLVHVAPLDRARGEAS